MLRLDCDEFSPEKSGRQWDFDWFDRAKVHLEPSLPRSVVVPQWELPFRRQKKGGIWEPISVQVHGMIITQFVISDTNALTSLTQEIKIIPITIIYLYSFKN